MVIEQKIHDIKNSFLEATLKYQDNVALMLEDKIIKYKELYLRSLSLKNIINQQNSNCSIIGVMAERNNEAAFVSIAASVIGGMVYVPLNPRFPDERLKQIIVNSGLEIIVVDAKNIDRAEYTIKLAEIIINIVPYVEVHVNSTNINILHNKCLEYSKDRTCYLLFTSGSTGTPKGVPISNTNLCSFLNHANKYFKVYQEDILSQTFDLSFDLSLFNIFMSWINGASLCLMNPLDLLNPTDYILRNKITIWFSVPTLVTNMRSIGKYNERFNSLRLSLFCGDTLNQKDVLFWQNVATNSVIENLYGPTEVTIACSRYRWIPKKSMSECIYGIVPIGKVFENLTPVILKDNFTKEAGPGELGELCIAGHQVFKGYIASKQDPFVKFRGIKYYKTGDLVCKLKSGNIAYVSRVDNQVKIHGYRIELSEIEYIIKSIQNVIEAVVLLDKKLIAFVKAIDLTKKDILKTLEQKLPKYMIPSDIHIIDEIPMNYNNKIDRVKLYKLLNIN